MASDGNNNPASISGVTNIVFMIVMYTFRYIHYSGRKRKRQKATFKPTTVDSQFGLNFPLT